MYDVMIKNNISIWSDVWCHYIDDIYNGGYIDLQVVTRISKWNENPKLFLLHDPEIASVWHVIVLIAMEKSRSTHERKEIMKHDIYLDQVQPLPMLPMKEVKATQIRADPIVGKVKIQESAIPISMLED